MRLPRLKGIGLSHYHCVSRVVGRQFVMGDEEKEHFVILMRKLEGFHGIRAVTFCVMSNHFHLLLEVPDPEGSAALDREEILRRIGLLYSPATVEDILQELKRAIASGDPRWEQEILDRYRRRMGDVSAFMKELKQRFSAWFNRRTGRVGTLWEERFKSVLVESDEQALMTIAAYIDLNPIRAGIVSRVEDYRWCGYASAVGGNRRARIGLGSILKHSPLVCGEDFETNWEEAASLYRLWLYNQGEIDEFPKEGGSPRHRGFTRKEVEAELATGGKLPLRRVIHLRVRYLTDGVVFGRGAFVEAVFERHRNRFGSKRKTGSRQMGVADWGDLRVMRKLRRVPVG